MWTTLTIGGLDKAEWPQMRRRILDWAAETGVTVCSLSSNHDSVRGRFWQFTVEHSEAVEEPLRASWNAVFFPRNAL